MERLPLRPWQGHNHAEPRLAAVVPHDADRLALQANVRQHFPHELPRQLREFRPSLEVEQLPPRRFLDPLEFLRPLEVLGVQHCPGSIDTKSYKNTQAMLQTYTEKTASKFRLKSKGRALLIGKAKLE